MNAPRLTAFEDTMNGLLTNFFPGSKHQISSNSEKTTSLGGRPTEKPQSAIDSPQRTPLYPQSMSRFAGSNGTNGTHNDSSAWKLFGPYDTVMQHAERDESEGAGMPLIQDKATRTRSQELTDLSKLPERKAACQALAKYRPTKPIPPFRERLCKTPPPAEGHWNIPIDWPPPKPSPCTAATDAAIIPPNGAPFHVHVQAYALRWGTWASSIKEYSRREQVLKFVTSEMRKAWETAIKEGYYPKSTAVVEDQSDDAAVQSKKVRKRAVSPSREAAPFASDGKPEAPITNGELEATGITMYVIDARVADRDLEEGEQLLKTKTEEKCRPLVKGDWTRHIYSTNTTDRDLLTFCLYTAQQCRKEASKLGHLLAHFTREQQKKNTQNRIVIYNERAEQHLALAIELFHQKQGVQQVSDDEQPDSEEIEPGSSSSDEQEQECDDNEIENNYRHDSTAAEDAKKVLHNLAHEVCSIKLLSGAHQVYETFTKRLLRPTNFAEHAGLTVNHPYWARMKRQLGLVFEHATKLSEIQKSQHRHSDNPSELIKIRKGAEFAEYCLFEAHQDLAALLSEDDTPRSGTAQCGTVQQGAVQTSLTERSNDGTQQGWKHSGLLEPSQVNPAISTHEPAPVWNCMQRTQYDVQPPVIRRQNGANIDHNLSAAQSGNTPSRESTATMGRSMTPSTSPAPATEQLSYTVPSHTTTSAPNAAAKLYIDKFWVPWLLHNQIQLPQEQIVCWPQIEELLQNRGVPPESIQQARTAFFSKLVGWIQRYNVKHSKNPMTSTMPTDEEVRLSIPPNGIAMNDLLELFYHRTNQEQLGELQAAIERVANFDPKECLLFVKTPSTVQPRMLDSRPKASPNTHQASPYHLTPPRPVSTQQAQQFAQLSPLSHTSQLHQNLPDKQPQQNKALTSQPHHKPPKLTLHLPKRTMSSSDNIVPEHLTYNPQDATDPYSHTQVNSTGSFSFRHLSTSTLAQRKRTEEHVEEYISRTRRQRRQKPWGQHVILTDPDDPQIAVAHGVWDTKDGLHPPGCEWFYAGEEPPGHWAEMLNESDEGAAQGVQKGRGRKREREGSVNTTGSAGGKKTKRQKKRVVEDDDEDWVPT